MLKNIIANFLGRFWSILSNFLFIPLYINFLGFESYSIISFGLVIAGIMAVLDAGLSATLSRELARSDYTITEKHKSFGTLESLYFLITLIAIIFLLSFSNLIASDWVNSIEYSTEEISKFIKVISFDIGFQLLLKFYLGGFLGLEYQIKSNILQVGWGITRNGLVILFIFFLPSLFYFFLWQAVSTLVFVIISGLLLRKQISGKFYFNVTRIEKSILKRTWKFAGGMLLISIVAAMNTQIDKIVISKLLPIESLGYYTLAVSLSMIIIILINPISVAILPRFTSYFSKKMYKEAKSLFYSLNIAVSILIFSFMTIICIFNYELIWIWTGNPDIALQSKNIVPLMAIGVGFLALQIIPFNIAIANGYTKINNILGISSLLITIPGYWYATSYFGIIGSVSVFTFVQVISAFIYIYHIDKKYFGIGKTKALFIKPIFIPLLLCLGIGYIFSFIPKGIEESRFLSLLWIGIATLFTFVSTLLILVPKAELFQFYKKLKFIKT